MALGDSLLDAAIKTYAPVDSYADDEDAAQKIDENQSILAQQQLKTQQAQIELGAEADETPLKEALIKEQTKNSLLSNAIATSPDAATWDAHMREIAPEFPEAQQYIGRYSPVLQSRLLSVYGGQPTAAVGMANTSSAGLDEQPAGTAKGDTSQPASAGLDYQFAQTTPEQRAGSLKALSTFSSALENVGDENSWNQMRAQLDKAGIPLMDQLGDYSPIKAASLYQRVQPILTYLQNRVVADQSGIPNPTPPNTTKAVGNTLFSVDPYGRSATPIATAPEFNATQGAFGTPLIYDKSTGKPAPAGDGTFGFDDFAARMNQAENGTGDRTAQNPNSSATGNGQFTDATWLQQIKQARPELAQNMSDAQLLQLRKDPAISQEMTEQYAQQNAQILQQNGQHVNATSLAMAHRLGPQGALSVLGASPDTPLSQILPPTVIKANPQLANVTAGDYAKQMAAQFGIDTIGAPGGQSADPNVHGDDFLKTLSPAMAAQVRGLAEGRIPFPSGISMSRLQPLIQATSQYDPTFDAVNYQARNKTRADFTSGQSAKALNAINTALGHAAGLQDNFDKLNNFGGLATPLNAPINATESFFGDQRQPVAAENVDSLASEARKVFAASGGGNLTELENWQKNFPINGSPAQQKGALQEFVNLLDSRMDALGDQYNKGMGTTEQPLNLLNPTGRAAYIKLTGQQPESGSVPGQNQPAAPAGAGGWTVKKVGGP